MPAKIVHCLAFSSGFSVCAVPNLGHLPCCWGGCCLYESRLAVGNVLWGCRPVYAIISARHMSFCRYCAHMLLLLFSSPAAEKGDTGRCAGAFSCSLRNPEPQACEFPHKWLHS